MNILGYSERGVINSLIYNIGEDKKLLKEFIELIHFPKSIEIGNPLDYEILLEQSLSGFGCSDLIIIIKYKKPENNKVLFFEGKVNTENSTWNISDQYQKHINNGIYNGYASNLFCQLYLKKLLIDNFSTINLGTINRVRDKFGVWRNIGENGVVFGAIEKISIFNEAYYIGIIPSNDADIKTFICNNFPQNGNPNHFVSWETIHSFCTRNNLRKVGKVFEFNKGQIY